MREIGRRKEKEGKETKQQTDSKKKKKWKLVKHFLNTWIELNISKKKKIQNWSQTNQTLNKHMLWINKNERAREK